jgi:hypothetical protein
MTESFENMFKGLVESLNYEGVVRVKIKSDSVHILYVSGMVSA